MRSPCLPTTFRPRHLVKLVAGDAQLLPWSAGYGWSSVAGLLPDASRGPCGRRDATPGQRHRCERLLAVLLPGRSCACSLPQRNRVARMELDWTQTLYDARMALCEAHRTSPTCAEQAKSSREWTLPVLYLTSKPFVLRGRDARAEPGDAPVVRGLRRVAPTLTGDERTAAETELQMLRGLVNVNLGAPQEALQAYQARIRRARVPALWASMTGDWPITLGINAWAGGDRGVSGPVGNARDGDSVPSCRTCGRTFSPSKPRPLRLDR